jgi:hypothetical protein
MFVQMDIFEFIEKPQESIKTERISLFDRLFIRINSPVTQCANCLCERCVNNAEMLWSKVGPEEQRKPCFNCDECRHYTGKNNIHKSQLKDDCGNFVISDYAAKQRREKIKKV